MSSKIAIGLSRTPVRSFALVLLGGVLTAACGTNASTNTPGTTGMPGAGAPAATGSGAGTGTPAASGTQPASSAGTGTPGSSTTPGTTPGTMGTTPMSGTMGAAGAGMMAAGGGTGGMGGGAAGAGMATGGTGAGTGGTMAPADCMKGMTKASEVVMIGDSYLALSGDVTTVLEMDATMAGALPAGQHYRPYYVSGTSMGNGQIPSQFDQALAADKDIKFVVMDGGGNDILLLNPMCESLADPGSDPSCMKSVADSETAGAALLQKMGDSGVQQVVWFFYPNLDPGLLAGSMPTNIITYGLPIMQKMCEGATATKCHFVDIRQAFMGHNADYIGVDGVHPTLAGSTVIANLLWDTMKANCIAQ